jgi:anti-anti-sigma factor
MEGARPAERLDGCARDRVRSRRGDRYWRVTNRPAPRWTAVNEFPNEAGDIPEIAVRGSRDASGWTFVVRGDLDLVTVPRLRAALADVFVDPSCDVLVDLHGVDFFEVTALNLFAETARRLDRTGGRLFLRGLSDFQHRILLTCGLTRLGSGAWTDRICLS